MYVFYIADMRNTHLYATMHVTESHCYAMCLITYILVASCLFCHCMYVFHFRWYKHKNQSQRPGPVFDENQPEEPTGTNEIVCYPYQDS